MALNQFQPRSIPARVIETTSPSYGDSSLHRSPASVPPPGVGDAFVGPEPGEVKTVITKVCVSEKGTVDSVTVNQSSGSLKVDEAAKKLMETGTYKVAVVEGKPVAACSLTKIEFDPPRARGLESPGQVILSSCGLSTA